MAMLTDEFIPLCRRAGLGRPPHAIGATGISMGGYGALLLAERHPALIAAVSAISPAVWTAYAQARAANAHAFTSARDFATHDVIAGAPRLRGVAVRVAAGTSDPFYPGVQALARVLPAGAVTHFSSGCHTGSFFDAQEPPSLEFLAAHLSTDRRRQDPPGHASRRAPTHTPLSPKQRRIPAYARQRPRHPARPCTRNRTPRVHPTPGRRGNLLRGLTGPSKVHGFTASRPYLMNSISEYFGNGHRSSATIRSSVSAIARTPSIAGSTSSRM